LTAPLAAAADKQERVLFVYLHDRHLVDSMTLAGAKPIVARMFAEIGVRVEAGDETRWEGEMDERAGL
jgi:hypothetical protein